MNWKIVAIIGIVIALFSGSFGLAQLEELQNVQTENLSESALNAKQQLLEAYTLIADMQSRGFNTTRATDTFAIAVNLYTAQVALEEKEGPSAADYAGITKKAEEIRAIRKSALAINDELKVLEGAIGRVQEGVDTSEAKSLYSTAVQDFKSERYELAKENIEKSYGKISEAESTFTQSAIIVQATKSLWEKLLSAWMWVVAISAAIIVIGVFGSKQIRTVITRGRVTHLELERQILEGLIKKTQETYFEKGTLSENTYHIRMKKYADLIRDINRQIPLLYEELEGGKVLKKTKNK